MAKNSEVAGYFFPVNEGMLVTEDMQARLEEKYRVAWDKSIENGDMLETMRISDAAHRDYIRMMAKENGAFWDPVMEVVISTRKHEDIGEALYRYHFGTRVKRNIGDLLNKGVDEFGIAAMSEALRDWVKNGWNPRNIAGMYNRAKNISASQGYVIGTLADIFKEEA